MHLRKLNLKTFFKNARKKVSRFQTYHLMIVIAYDPFLNSAVGRAIDPSSFNDARFKAAFAEQTIFRQLRRR